MIVVQPSPQHEQSHSPRKGFTLVELLISLGIIFILISLAFYALRTVRRSASRTQTLNALKQMGAAYNSYSSEHNGALMPGYITATDFAANRPFAELGETGRKGVRLLGSNYQLQNEDASSYVWRLAPYLDNAWKTYLVDYHNSEIESRMVDEYSCGSDTCPPYTDPDTGTTYTPPAGVFGPAGATGTQLGISERPAIGLNSIFVGGDSKHGDPLLNPWDNPTGRVAAVRQSEVRSSGKMIVFGATRVASSGATVNSTSAGTHLGYPVLCPPFAFLDRDTQAPSNPQWRLESEADDSPFTLTTLIGTASADTTGVPIDRVGDIVLSGTTVKLRGDHKVPVSHLDGSVAAEMLESLSDFPGAGGTGPERELYLRRLMSRWSPFAFGNE